MGDRYRQLIDIIRNRKPGIVVEIGTWKGSSTCSALCNNNMTCVAIDNFQTFGGPKHEFLANFNKFKGNNEQSSRHTIQE